MKILSLHLGHNSTVVLVEDGRIVGALSQEKCDNVKNSAVFPNDAFNLLMEEVGWKTEDIDEICVSGKQIYPKKAYDYLYDSKNRIKDNNRGITLAKQIREGLAGKMFPFVFEWVQKVRSQQLVKQGYSELHGALTKMGLKEKKLTFIEHHECHARAAFHSFGRLEENQKSLIFTMDGSGDDLCATVTKVDGNKWERIAETPARSSIGGIYSNTTRFLGMKILEHEYKVMGLAPYAKESYMLDTYERIFKPVIWLSQNDPLIFESRVDASKFYSYLVEHAVGERFDNLSAALQHMTEELVLQWIRNAIKLTGIRRIFTGGGVFMNVKLNRRIQEMDEVEKVCFMPSCGDESNPIGAGYAHAVQRGNKPQPLENLFLGVSYSDEAIDTYIHENNLENEFIVDKFDDIESQIAELIAQREIVARFSGRCEWGARSLGNRAILGHPSHMESFYTINDYIKSRDFWMPFAPSILDIDAPKYLEGYCPDKARAPHMITAFSASKLGVDHLRAALHQGDHTLRPQVVTQEECPDYYRLIQMFKEKTGVGAVLNTSFNLHGYPLVASPKQAVMTLKKSDLKHLAMGSFLLSKR